MERVYLVTSGDGSDGNEWGLISIHRTKEGAELAKKRHEAPVERRDGSVYVNNAEVEEWNIFE